MQTSRPLDKVMALQPFGMAAACGIAVLPLLLSWSRLPSAPLALLSSMVAWLGTGALAASLLLMIREPAISGVFGGLERMYRWHHALGTASYALLLAHPLIIAGQSLPRYDLAWQRVSPGSLTTVLGWAAVACLMLGLGATFAVRLPYRLWRNLHMVLGTGAALGIAHVAAAIGFGSALFLAGGAAGAALAWRLLRADHGGSARPYEVSAVSRPARDMVEATLRPLAAPILAAPGQFVLVAFFEGPRYRGCGEYHPFTASGICSDGTLRLTMKALGDCTRNIQRLEPGVAARVQGPFGTFFEGRLPLPEVWLAGGIGIAPFLALLRAGPVSRETHLLYSYREPDDAGYVDELRRHAIAQPLLHFQSLVLGSNSDALLSELARIPDLAARQVFVCGPPELLSAATGWLRQHGVPKKNIHYERFDFR